MSTTTDPSIGLPITLKYAKQIKVLARNTFKGGVNLTEGDHFGFMALCFGYKQLEHADSIEALVDTGAYDDTQILARVMLEGLIILNWASLDSSVRGLRWRSYVLVSDWKLLQSNSNSRNKVKTDESYQNELKERLAELGNPYLTSRARKQGKESFDDPYQNTWMVNDNGSKIELSHMVEEIGNPALKSIYDDISQYMHWTPKGLGRLLRRSEGKVNIKLNNPSAAVQSLAISMQMLGSTVEIISDHFRLDIKQCVQEILSLYIDEMKKKSP